MGAGKSPDDCDLALVTRIIAAATLDTLNLPDAVFMFFSVAMYAASMTFHFCLLNPSWITSASFQFGRCPASST